MLKSVISDTIYEVNVQCVIIRYSTRKFQQYRRLSLKLCYRSHTAYLEVATNHRNDI